MHELSIHLRLIYSRRIGYATVRLSADFRGGGGGGAWQGCRKAIQDGGALAY